MTIHVTLTATNERGDVLNLTMSIPYAEATHALVTEAVGILVNMASVFHDKT